MFGVLKSLIDLVAEIVVGVFHVITSCLGLAVFGTILALVAVLALAHAL